MIAASEPPNSRDPGDVGLVYPHIRVGRGEGVMVLGGILSEAQVEQFISDGFVKLDGAFPQEVGEACRDWLWDAMGLSPDEPDSWTEAKIWITEPSDAQCFLDAAGSSRLTGAFDDLAGAGRWQQYERLGTFPIRFPSLPATEPDDDKDWHVEGSWKEPDEDIPMRTNVFSRNRLLLVLFLFSDVDADDGATRLMPGSHLEVARRLEAYGVQGIPWPVHTEIAADLQGPETGATGSAGDVYLCHPFLAHAAAANVGNRVRFIAQPALVPREDVCLERTDGTAYSPVEQAIRIALGRQPGP